MVGRETQTPRREHPGRHRPERVPGLGLAGRTRLHPRPERRPPARSARPLSGRRRRVADPGRQGLRRRRDRHPPPLQGRQPLPRQPHPQLLLCSLRAPAERPNALLKSFKALRRPSAGSLSAPGGSATSPPPPSSSSPCNEAAGEKTSVTSTTPTSSTASDPSTPRSRDRESETAYRTDSCAPCAPGASATTPSARTRTSALCVDQAPSWDFDLGCESCPMRPAPVVTLTTSGP